MKLFKVLSFATVLLVMLLPVSTLQAQVSFGGPELLGRPTDHSVTINVVANAAMQAYVEYGTESGNYPYQTSTFSSAANQPLVVVLSNLQSNTRYYYRMVYRQTGTSSWTTRAEHFFYTQRPPGSTFTFTVTSDSHINIVFGNPSLFRQTLTNIAGENPDFHLDLGDTFAMDNVTTQTQANSNYLNLRSYFGLISPSVPIFLALGNHEQEEGWHLDDTGNLATSPPVMSTNARNQYYLNPDPLLDSFYTGNTDVATTAINGDHAIEDYYAWQWGDALFVVIDPYWYTTTKPYVGNEGGGESSDVGSGDRWDWTLGLDQYLWLKQTLENSQATYKFIFAHQVAGGMDDYGRGGANAVPFVEWGGYNDDGTTEAFDSRRPAWPAPTHQLLVDNHVTAFFHGHDHEFAYEKRDGVIYQLVPMAADATYGYGFQDYHETDPYTIRVLPNSGHLRVTVSPSQVTVDYIRAFLSGKGTNGQVAYTYSISGQTWSISGTISPVAGGSGATVKLSGPSNATVTADASGNFTFTNVANGACTVTPSNPGYVFTPASQSATVNGADVTGVAFTAIPAYAVSGSISPSSLSSGANVALAQGPTTIANATVDGSGNFSFPSVVNGAYTVTPTKSGVNFTPPSQPVTVNGTAVSGVSFTASAQTWTVSGTIGNGSGAAVSLTQGSTTIATTAADGAGNYSFSNVANGSYTLMPSKTGFVFTPASRNITINGADAGNLNFTANPVFPISGSITPSASGSGATVNLTQGSTTITTTAADTSGNFTFNNVLNGTYTVTPTKSGFGFTPASQSLTVNGAPVTGVSFAAQAVVSALAIDKSVSTDRSSSSKTIASPAFTTSAASELLLAFVSADGPSSGTNTTVSGITGGSLTWVLVRRTNTQYGTAEVWRAFAPAVLTNAIVTATLSTSVAASITVVTFTGVDTTGSSGSGAIGATGSGNSGKGAPAAGLTTTRNNSWVFGVGSDWDNATARTVPANQTMVHQYLATVGDTYWVQRLTSPTPLSGTAVTINDTAPSGDRYNLTIVEILPSL